MKQKAEFNKSWYCLKTIESMCSVFHWSDSPHSTNLRAKVAWLDVCKPKTEGGGRILGIRRMVDLSRVFALSLILCFLTNSGSLWITWTKQNLLHRQCFWDVSDIGSGSWIWSKLLRLRQQAASYLRSAINNGRNTLFWFDNWLDMKKLLDVANDSGTQFLGILAILLLLMQPCLDDRTFDGAAAITYWRW